MASLSEIRQRIAELYGEKILDRSALSIRGGAGVLERVLRGKGYGTVVEIGTYRGVAAAEMAQYCRQVVTIDLEFGKLERAGETWSRRAMWNALGTHNIIGFLVEGDEEKAAILKSIKFDFAFIDGAHDDKSVALDFALTKHCGRVLFHDYERRGVPGQDCVCDFVDSLPKNEVTPMDIFALWVRPGVDA